MVGGRERRKEGKETKKEISKERDKRKRGKRREGKERKKGGKYSEMI